MRIVDANVLLYAVNSASGHHRASKRSLDGALSGADTVGLAWVPLLAFVRLTTKHGLFLRPLAPGDAMQQVADWCSAPGSVVVGPTPRHADVLSGLLAQVGTGGILSTTRTWRRWQWNTGAGIISYDSDFSRFAAFAGHPRRASRARLLISPAISDFWARTYPRTMWLE